MKERRKYIDRIDIEMLNFMRANPKASIAEIGDRVDLTHGPTNTRIMHLAKEGLFQNAIQNNYRKLGFEIYIVTGVIEGIKSFNDFDINIKEVLSTKDTEGIVLMYSLLEVPEHQEHCRIAVRAMYETGQSPEIERLKGVIEKGMKVTVHHLVANKVTHFNNLEVNIGKHLAIKEKPTE